MLLALLLCLQGANDWAAAKRTAEKLRSIDGRIGPSAWRRPPLPARAPCAAPLRFLVVDWLRPSRRPPRPHPTVLLGVALCLAQRLPRQRDCLICLYWVYQGKEVVRTLIDRHAGTLEVSGR